MIIFNSYIPVCSSINLFAICRDTAPYGKLLRIGYQGWRRMLRKLLPLVLLLQPVMAYAISCPNSDKILETGDSLEHVLAVCGKPTSIEKTDNDVLLDGTLTYNKPNGPNVVFTITDQYVTKIETTLPCDEAPCPKDNTQVINFYTGCDLYIYIGNNVPFVTKNCGIPDKIKADKIIPDTTQRLLYPSSAGPNVLIIYNGELTDWDTQ